jgi:hypothetical protein
MTRREGGLLGGPVVAVAGGEEDKLDIAGQALQQLTGQELEDMSQVLLSQRRVFIRLLI